MYGIESVLWTASLKLITTWKDHFGLGTQHVGYLSASMLKTLCKLKRISDDTGDWQLSELNLRSLNSMAIQYGLNKFSPNKDVESVLPKLFKVLEAYDFSSTSIDDAEWAEWNDFIRYLESKGKKEA